MPVRDMQHYNLFIKIMNGTLRGFKQIFHRGAEIRDFKPHPCAFRRFCRLGVRILVIAGFGGALLVIRIAVGFMNADFPGGR
jgi:hypothetical protein